MKLARYAKFITTKHVEEEGLRIITNTLAQAKKIEDTDEVKYYGTILDPFVHENGGAIPIPKDFEIVNIHNVAKKLNKRFIRLQRNLFDTLRNTDVSLLNKAEGGHYLYVSPYLGLVYTTRGGVDVASNLQNRFDNMVEYFQEWEKMGRQYNKNLEYQYNRGYNRLMDECARTLFGKKGLYERATSGRFPHSVRAVIIPDPTLELNQTEIPSPVLVSWLKDKQFREDHGVPEDLSMRDMIRHMNGERVLALRWPIHCRTNLMSMRLRTTKRRED